ASRVFPQVSRLVDGICKVSAVSRRDVVLANFITATSGPALARSCGAMGWLEANGPVLAQALDLGLTNATTTALVEPAGDVPFVAHMNVGTIWFSTGVNANAVAIGGASVNVRRDVALSP